MITQAFKVQQGGHAAYEATAKHKCPHLVDRFREMIHWQLAPAKPNPDKFDDYWCDGICLGVMWRTGGFIVGTAEGIFKCSTIRKRPIDNAYDVACVGFIIMSYEDFISKGAKPEGVKLRFAPNATPFAADTPGQGM